MRHVILYRRCNNLRDDDLELEAIQASGFTLLSRRTEVKKGDLVVARYSCLPMYNEYAADLEHAEATLLNTAAQHNYIADLQNWVVDLREMTPETWSRIEDIPEEGPFVLKGGTNSRKGQWRTHMFAQDKEAAIEVYSRLSDDSLIGRQPIYIRKFVPLYTYGVNVAGMPVTKEFRFFICDENILCGAYYWSSNAEELGVAIPSATEVPNLFLQEAISRIAENPNAPRAYTLDVALKQDGEPVVIEINDLQMAGLSENSPFLFYRNLKRQLEKADEKR